MSFLPNEAKASPLLGDVIFSYPSGQLKWGLQQVEEGLKHAKKKLFKYSKTLR